MTARKPETTDRLKAKIEWLEQQLEKYQLKSDWTHVNIIESILNDLRKLYKL